MIRSRLAQIGPQSNLYDISRLSGSLHGQTSIGTGGSALNHLR